MCSFAKAIAADFNSKGFGQCGAQLQVLVDHAAPVGRELALTKLLRNTAFRRSVRNDALDDLVRQTQSPAQQPTVACRHQVSAKDQLMCQFCPDAVTRFSHLYDFGGGYLEQGDDRIDGCRIATREIDQALLGGAFRSSSQWGVYQVYAGLIGERVQLFNQLKRHCAVYDDYSAFRHVGDEAGFAKHDLLELHVVDNADENDTSFLPDMRNGMGPTAAAAGKQPKGLLTNIETQDVEASVYKVLSDWVALFTKTDKANYIHANVLQC